MVIDVKLSSVLAPRSGKSRKGTDWVVQEFVGETTEQYPKKICFQLYGEERIKSLETLHIGDEVRVSFDIESREFSGKWFTQCNAWRLSALNATTGTSTHPAQESATEPQKTEQGENLPF